MNLDFDNTFLNLCLNGLNNDAFEYYLKYGLNRRIFENILDEEKYNDIITGIPYAFVECCKLGNLQIVKWLYEIIRQESDNEYDRIHTERLIMKALSFACHFRQYEIIRWIYQLGILKKSQIVLECICYDLLDWLDTLIDFYDDTDRKTIMSYIGCYTFKNCFKLTKWMYNKYPYYFTANKKIVHQLFCNWCTTNDLESIQWLYSTFDIDIRYNSDKAFLNACYGYDKDVAIINAVTKNNIYMIKNLNVIEWLCSISNGVYSIINVDGQNQYKIKTIKDDLEQSIDKYYENATIIQSDIDCAICLDDSQEKWIQLIDCNHMMCLSCYLDRDIKKCSFGCNTNIEKISFIKKITQ